LTNGADNAESAALTERDRTRPIGIVLLVVFQVLNMTASVLAVAGVLGPRTGSVIDVLGNDIPIVNGVVIATVVLTLIGAIGLWRLRRFGWYMIMLLTGLGLAIQIAFFIWATPNYINLAIYVVSAFYLNQHAVKSIFLEPPAEPESVVLAVEEDDQR
jgi:uncharacterized membrane protein (DUF2068 family)